MKRFLALTIICFAIAGTAQAAPWASQCITPIAIGQTINATLATTDCSLYFDDPTELYYTDIYQFSGTAGQRIAIAMNSADVDAWLELYDVNDADGSPLESDDDGGDGTNARIPSIDGYYTLPTTGTYYIWANTASPALQTGAYTISITEAVADPVPGNCMTPIAFGQTISGTLSATDCPTYYGSDPSPYYTDVYTFSGTRGQQIAIAMNSTAVDAWLELHDTNDLNGVALE